MHKVEKKIGKTRDRRHSKRELECSYFRIAFTNCYIAKDEPELASLARCRAKEVKKRKANAEEFWAERVLIVLHFMLN